MTPPRQAPARVITVTDGRLSLVASAYLELHGALAAAAREGGGSLPEPARAAYARVLRDDDEETVLGRTTRALLRCESDACARAAVEPEGFGGAYARDLPRFAETEWPERSRVAWSGIEASAAALGPAGEALTDRAASQLGLRWPDRPVRVAIVGTAPSPARGALVPSMLEAGGSCFVRVSKSDGDRRARLLDCILVQVLVAVPSEARDRLERQLGARDGWRAYQILAAHVSALVVTAWHPSHTSVVRRSLAAVEARTVEWLAKEWRPSEPASLERYATFWQTEHANGR